MNNLMVTRMDEDDFIKREMGEFEIRGAMLSVYQLAREFDEHGLGESYVTIEDINNDCYYCNKKLEFTSKYYIYDKDYNGIAIDSMFCVEGSIDNIFAYAHKIDDEEEDLFVVRIS